MIQVVPNDYGSMYIQICTHGTKCISVTTKLPGYWLLHIPNMWDAEFLGWHPSVHELKFYLIDLLRSGTFHIAGKLPALRCGIHCGITISRVVVNKARLKQLPKEIYVDLKVKPEK